MLNMVNRFAVSRAIVGETEAALRRAGADGCELFVLWSGRCTGSTFEVRTHHVPKQVSYKLDGGLCVRVEGDELHRLNVWLYEAEEMLGVQVHAHPTHAYHSETDDTFPIVASLGGLSVVAADFCSGGLFTNETAMYRLSRTGWVLEHTRIVDITS